MARKPQQPADDQESCDPAWSRAVAEQLLPWFRRHQRELPWRESADPYRVWLSEIMLQQTQVVTVIPYFERFVARFPTVAELASADEQDVLRLWEGLGYYRRARQLLAAAKVVANEHHGTFPQTLEALQGLPGIGRYTAGAIASIAYDLPAPILEANTVRLLARLAAIEGDPTSTEVQSKLWNLAEALLPRKRCGEFNQALMELGSLVCTPREPKCDECPLREQCAAFQQGRQDSLPAPKAKQVFESVREAAVIVEHRGRVYLRQCAAGERWAGLWDFARFAVSNKRGRTFQDELRQKVSTQTGLEIESIDKFTTLKHGVTRFRITLDCYRAECVKSPRLKAGSQWFKPAELADVPLSTTGRKLARLLVAQLAETRE
jgi:A/G-specific adenine glycosylase